MPWAGIGLPRWGEVVGQNLGSSKPFRIQAFGSLERRRIISAHEKRVLSQWEAPVAFEVNSMSRTALAAVIRRQPGLTPIG
ncbi:hypothetical protein CEE69_00430 [Rhodopirellula bahusiensis]|uniref:Uncharacterized protein n=1 Tax=Rhodopirellula bahusiensis TaxID=2014065 RepID=A0A2G1WCY6_9BACT|nr:hypothetical protein CEE69_00430 [Rhodopirellula bahusiensis]